MSSRSTQNSRNDALSAVEAELKREQAAAMGRMGHKVEQALDALRNASDADSETQARLVQNAAHTVWQLFVQREACGINNHQMAIAAYGIPPRVLARVGTGKPR
jgi:hypothetical protein